MLQTVDLLQIKEKLIKQLKPSGWAVKLRTFINSSDFEKILETLWNLKQEGNRFTPPLKQAFRAFEQCPYENLKIVLIGQDPYPQLGVADGIAFSCGNTDKLQPSLRNVFEALEATVFDQPTIQHPDLTRWSNQGVLLLNTALTCQVDKPGSHYEIWNPFIMYLLDILCFTNAGLVFILLGKKAQELENYITPNHYILKASHPASAAYSKTIWDCNDVFNKANQLLEKNNGPSYKINW